MDPLFRSKPLGGWSHESLKNFRHITPNVQQHLKLLYLTLCSSLLFNSFGAYLHGRWNIGGAVTFLGFFCSLVWLLDIPTCRKRMRLGILMSASVLEGATVCPLLKFAFKIDLSIVLTSLIGTALAFGCFSAVAIMTTRRKYLYLGGYLSSGLSILLWLRYANSLFGGSVAMFNAEICFGLLVVSCYIVLDTQLMIERAFAGDVDYVRHSMELFTDYTIIVRMLIALLKNESAKSERNRKKKSS